MAGQESEAHGEDPSLMVRVYMEPETRGRSSVKSYTLEPWTPEESGMAAPGNPLADLAVYFRAHLTRVVETMVAHSRGNTTPALVNQECRLVMNHVAELLRRKDGGESRAGALQSALEDGIGLVPKEIRDFNAEFRTRLFEVLLPHLHEGPLGAFGEERHRLESDQETIIHWFRRLGAHPERLNEKIPASLKDVAMACYYDGSFGNAIPSDQDRDRFVAFIREGAPAPLMMSGSGYAYPDLQAALDALRSHLRANDFYSGSLAIREGEGVDFDNLRDPEGNPMGGLFGFRVRGDGSPWHKL
jgi:hypothetical protein